MPRLYHRAHRPVMHLPWRLTRQAKASLVGIARWTLETFGPRQAEVYEEDLIARCQHVADRMAPSQDCRRLIAPDLSEDLRFTRSGQHFIVFIQDVAQVINVDFLYSWADLPGRLAAPTSAKPESSH